MLRDLKRFLDMLNNVGSYIPKLADETAVQKKIPYGSGPVIMN